MKRITIAATAVLAVATTALALSAQGRHQFSEFLNGLKEAPQIVATSGTGTFKATINNEGTEIAYELTFSNLESDVRQAHIHSDGRRATARSCCGSAIRRPPTPRIA